MPRRCVPSGMSDAPESQTGFGTGLRAALARARQRREPSLPPEAAVPEVVSPELALVAPELRAETTVGDAEPVTARAR